MYVCTAVLNRASLSVIFWFSSLLLVYVYVCVRVCVVVVIVVTFVLRVSFFFFFLFVSSLIGYFLSYACSELTPT